MIGPLTKYRYSGTESIIQPIQLDKIKKFERAFDTAFTDTTKQQNAHNALRQLRIQGNDLDNYIATFKKLARDAGYALDAQGTIFVFTTGLKPGLRKAILH
jgi:Retrotransposon gag protein